jgi:hypothetical protein
MYHDLYFIHLDVFLADGLVAQGASALETLHQMDKEQRVTEISSEDRRISDKKSQKDLRMRDKDLN